MRTQFDRHAQSAKVSQSRIAGSFRRLAHSANNPPSIPIRVLLAPRRNCPSRALVKTLPACYEPLPMDGTVHTLNPEEGLVAIDTSAGFSVFEQTGQDFDIGDFVSWSQERQLGGCDVRNVSRGRSTRVYFLNHGVPGTFLKVNLKL
jgi:hypothetical protein